jgi:hypothetical protein
MVVPPSAQTKLVMEVHQDILPIDRENGGYHIWARERVDLVIFLLVLQELPELLMVVVVGAGQVKVEIPHNQELVKVDQELLVEL